jgi:hypothetical protein
VGRLMHGHGDADATRALLIPDEAVPLMHVQATLDADHQVVAYDMVVALLYAPGEDPPPGVIEAGDRWDSGDMRIYLFEDDDAAAAARESG